jgi:ketosteroid isomerase-like protein
MAVHANFSKTQSTWDQINSGDYTHALDEVRDDVVVENGPGAGKWRHIEGKDAYVTMMMEFLPLFGDTWKQNGTCVYADDRMSISLVGESGKFANGDVFENLAVWISRFDKDGNVDRQWTVDIDQEAMEAFWDRNS